MKKRILMLVALIALVGIPVSAEIELGLGGTPVPTGGGDDSERGSLEWLWTLHGGLSALGVLYVSVDTFILPPPVAENLSRPWIEDSKIEGGGYFGEGYARPGMLSLLDVGLRLRLWSLVLSAQLGMNNLYLYRQAELEDNDMEFRSNLGANIKVGVGWKLGRHLDVLVNGYSIQPSMEHAIRTMKGLASDSEMAQKDALDQLMDGFLYSIVAVLHF